MANINKYNFIRWDSNINEIDNTIIQTPYKRLDVADYIPILIKGEETSFYINCESGLKSLLGDFNHTLQLLNIENNLYYDNLGTITSDEYTTDNYTIYGSINPLGDLITYIPEGYYRMVIRNNTTNEIVLQSNLIQVLNENTDEINKTNFIEWRHDRYFYGFNYQSKKTFYNKLRLHIFQTELHPESDKSLYREVTTGKVRMYQNQLDLVRKLESYYFDSKAHLAAFILFESSTILINKKQYSTKTAYKENQNQLQYRTKGEVELYDYEFSSVNRCSITTTLGTPSVCPAPTNIFAIRDIITGDTAVEFYATGNGVAWTIKRYDQNQQQIGGNMTGGNSPRIFTDNNFEVFYITLQQHCADGSTSNMSAFIQVQ